MMQSWLSAMLHEPCTGEAAHGDTSAPAAPCGPPLRKSAGI